MDAVPEKPVPENVQESARDAMINVVVEYGSKKPKTSVSPASMKLYVPSLPGTFKEWGYKMCVTLRPIFNHRKYGLKAVCDNNFFLSNSRRARCQSSTMFYRVKKYSRCLAAPRAAKKLLRDT